MSSLWRSATLAPAVVSLSLAARTATAGFVGGLERFDGTTKDLMTWEEMAIFSGSSIGQNDALLMHAPYAADYTTRQLKVGINQGVHAEVTMLSTEPGGFDGWGVLALTTNSNGTSGHLMGDSQVLSVEVHSFFGGILASHMSSGSGTGEWVAQNVGNVYQTFVLSIFRTNLNSAEFSARGMNGQFLGGTTLTFSNVPDDLYVGMYSQTADVKYDNVAIIPEPVGVAVVATTVAPAFARARRRRLALRI